MQQDNEKEEGCVKGTMGSVNVRQEHTEEEETKRGN